MKRDFSNTHGSKLNALLHNPRLPPTDRPRVEEAIRRYHGWRESLLSVDGTLDQKTAALVALLNDYRWSLDVELVFSSASDFLYRQKGQIKLDNSVIEEFLPIFLSRVLDDLPTGQDWSFGPNTCFASIYFTSTLTADEAGAGLSLRQKDQDFVISRPLYLQASHYPDFAQAVTRQTHLAYIAAECKTNLDKTMFQESAATALDLKTSLPAARYFLLCEWLDMTPISSSVTAIDEIIMLRKAKRLPAEIRKHFNTAQGRITYRAYYETYLREHPFAPDMFTRFATHVRDLIADRAADDVLDKGYF